jgi:hypothetical protein
MCRSAHAANSCSPALRVAQWGGDHYSLTAASVLSVNWDIAAWDIVQLHTVARVTTSGAFGT